MIVAALLGNPAAIIGSAQEIPINRLSESILDLEPQELLDNREQVLDVLLAVWMRVFMDLSHSAAPCCERRWRTLIRHFARTRGGHPARGLQRTPSGAPRQLAPLNREPLAISGRGKMSQTAARHSDALVDYSGLSKTLGDLGHSFSLLEFLDLCAVLEGIVLHDRLVVVGGNSLLANPLETQPRQSPPSRHATSRLVPSPGMERWRISSNHS